MFTFNTPIFLCVLFITFTLSTALSHAAPVKIGWAEVDITPIEQPVFLAGQQYARVSMGVHTPLKATALVLESEGEHAVFVTVDAVTISPLFYSAIRNNLDIPDIDPSKIIVNATHTHTAPINNHRLYWQPVFDKYSSKVASADSYVNFAATQINSAIAEAWKNRTPGGVAFGQDYAVIGRNRRWVDNKGTSKMYGLNKTSAARFSHIEGYEDHSLNILATYDTKNTLTGLIVNIASPSQETEHLYEISADFWHETRAQLRQRFGENIFILPQCSAAGDQTSHLIFENEPHERMLILRERTGREEIAIRIADAVERILPYLQPTIETEPILKHHHETVPLPLNQLTEADVADATTNQAEWLQKYDAEIQRIEDDPSLLQEPRWYVRATRASGRAAWYGRVKDRFDKFKNNPFNQTEVHIVRLGDIAFATNPFEYYLDYGIQIKVKSPAIQTFIVQLAGSGSYIPNVRAAAGGGYGAVPASVIVGPEGGQKLADYTVEKLQEIMKDSDGGK